MRMMVMIVVMAMVVPVIMIVVVVMIVRMVVVMMVVIHIQPTFARAICVTQTAIRHVRSRGGSTLAFNMVVMAFLDGTNFCLEPQNLGAVFAQYACGRWQIAKRWMIGIKAFVGGDQTGFLAFDFQDLGSVLTRAAVGHGHSTHLFFDAFGECFQHLWVIAQIARFGELNVWVFGRAFIGKAVNTVDQDARE